MIITCHLFKSTFSPRVGVTIILNVSSSIFLWISVDLIYPEVKSVINDDTMTS